MSYTIETIAERIGARRGGGHAGNYRLVTYR